ncbi:putative serine esterase-domain-containing protein [Paraphysoderma sedebokerense]|nr:putative serine esterase-domain-containing protein [Paraphysoderma sedebokerense]
MSASSGPLLSFVPVKVNEDCTKPEIHVWALSHGLYGHPGHLWYIEEKLKGLYGDKIEIFTPSINAVELTFDGVDVCGERFLRKVLEHYEVLSSSHRVTKISFLGYSLGGIIARYAVGKLYSMGFFKHVTPSNFVTIATPHLGGLKKESSLFRKIFNEIPRRGLYRSGKQMALMDKDWNGVPLLVLMSDPIKPFYKGLKMFPNILLVSNVVGDNTVGYTGPAIATSNPYTRYEPLRSSECPFIVTPSTTPVIKSAAAEAMKIVRITPFLMLFVPVFITVWVVGVIPLMSYNTYRAQQRWHGGVADYVSVDWIHHKALDEEEVSVDVETQHSESSAQEEAGLIRSASVSADSPAASVNAQTIENAVADPSSNPEVSKYREQMCTWMNTLSLNRIDVWLSETQHTHGAIVVRHSRLHQNGKKVIEYVLKRVSV